NSTLAGVIQRDFKALDTKCGKSGKGISLLYPFADRHGSHPQLAPKGKPECGLLGGGQSLLTGAIFHAADCLCSGACTPCKRSSLLASARSSFSRRKCSSRDSP